MKLSFRPPRDNEWPICRMLLPETFAHPSGRTYLLGVRDEAPHVVGAASFRRVNDSITGLRLHVVAKFRRCGAASEIIRHLEELGGGGSMEGIVEIDKEPAGEAFSRHHHFERLESLTTVEADMSAMREYMGRLCGRLAPPQNARIIPLSEAPAEEVARLHAQHVAQEGELNQWRGLVAQTPEMGISPVAMIDGQVAGILLGEVKDGIAVVRTRVVAPGYHGSWVNAMLLAEALNIGWEAGARRCRFSFTESNRDTQKLAKRFNAEQTSTLALYRRI